MSEWTQLGEVPSLGDHPATQVRVGRTAPGRFGVKVGVAGEHATVHSPSEARAVAKLLELGADEAERSDERVRLREQLDRVERGIVGSGG